MTRIREVAARYDAIVIEIFDRCLRPIQTILSLMIVSIPMMPAMR